jgi:hypothetical protein
MKETASEVSESFVAHASIFSPPPRSGGEGSGVGGSATFTEAAVPAERPPTPNPSPPRAMRVEGGELTTSPWPAGRANARPMTGSAAVSKDGLRTDL